MTCIAWDGKLLAADKLVISGYKRASFTKIRRIGDALVGFAGNTILTNAMFSWIEIGENPDKFPEAQRDKDNFTAGMKITLDGQIYLYENAPIPWLNERKIWAIGSGAEIAIGAMAAGASAEDAVKIACEWCYLTGGFSGGVDVLSF